MLRGFCYHFSGYFLWKFTPVLKVLGVVECIKGACTTQLKRTFTACNQYRGYRDALRDGEDFEALSHSTQEPITDPLSQHLHPRLLFSSVPPVLGGACGRTASRQGAGGARSGTRDAGSSAVQPIGGELYCRKRVQRQGEAWDEAVRSPRSESEAAFHRRSGTKTDLSF